MYAICQRTRAKLDEVGDQYGVERRYTSFDDLIRDPEVDAVHINSPIHLHAPQSIAALRAGKHVASHRAGGDHGRRSAARSSRRPPNRGRNYMMMETAIYTREFLFIREMRGDGQVGTHPVHARLPSAGNGRLAGILGRPAADALRHPRRQPLPGAGAGRSRAGLLLRLGADCRPPGGQVRLARSRWRARCSRCATGSRRSR